MKGTKNILYMGLALGMLFYAVPRLDIGSGLTLPTVFGVVWVVFALMIIAAHLHEILGVEEETKREIAKVKRMKRWQLEQLVRGKRKMLQFRK
ncbi:hypothetical protein [Paenibacillus piri]|uniref:hypothetical protein n=1 Tax=Paenibacillus piri TaxID=2547395 RepID=UPI001FE24B84|nr:hypothetical protein [Paenibacillus piri]